MIDLPPDKNPKGGSPRTPPRGIPVREYQEQHPTPLPEVLYQYPPSNHTAVWRTIAVAQMSVMVAGAGIIWTIGINNVKWTDIDGIMATRAPYIHDKQRIQENLNALRQTDLDAAVARSKLESRVQDLERHYYSDHPEQRP